MRAKHGLALILIAGGLASFSSCQAQSVTSPDRSTPGSSLPTASLTRVHDPGHVTGSLKGPCRTRDAGRLPDLRCTPGSYDPGQTREVLCAPGFSTRGYRPPADETSRIKRDVVLPAYGMRGTRSELDHLVPLELGGSNDLSNLWSEAGPIPNPKDAVENRLHREVCAGTISLPAAQQEIATNWENAK